MTKRLCLLVVACLLVVTLKSQAAVTNVHALVTFTNTVKGVTNGDTITVNGDIRRYTNGILAAPASWILSTNNVGWAATNTWLHLATYSPAGVDRIYNTNTNALVIVGTFRTNTALVVSLSSGVGTVSYSTNVWAEAYSLMAPNGSLATEAARTNNASGLIGLLNDNRQTNAVNNGVAALSNLLDRISQQTASNKLFYASTNSRGLLDYTRVTNAAGIQGSNAVLVGVNLTGVTNLTGTNVTLTNASVYTVGLYGLTTANGNVGLLTNGGWRNAGLTNGFAVSQTNVNGIFSNLINYGQAIRSEGTGGNSLQVGSNALALGALSVAIGNTAEADDEGTIALGTSALADGVYGTAIGVSSRASARSVAVGNTSLADSSDSVAIGYGATASQDVGISIGQGSSVTAQVGTAIGSEASVSGVRGIAIGQGAFADSHAAIAFGYGANANHSNSLALGPTDHAGNAVATTTTNQLRLGTANHTVSIPGQLLVSGTQSNTTFTGTNLARGAWAYPRYDLNTLGGGNNLAVPVGTNRFVRVGSGPASAATIVGMVGGAITGGIDGQDVVLYNDTGYGLTFAVNSVDPVPANRINTPTATDITIPDQGWAQFFYDGTDARWKLINAYSGTNLVATATNINVTINTNGTSVGSGLTVNFTTGVTGYVSGGTINLGVSAAGGGGSLVTNANQFGASTTLTIKDGVLLTNSTHYGGITTDTLVTSPSYRSTLQDQERVLGTDPNGYFVELSTPVSKVAYVDNVTSDIQAQLDAKASTNQLNGYVKNNAGVATNVLLYGSSTNFGTIANATSYHSNLVYRPVTLTSPASTLTLDLSGGSMQVVTMTNDTTIALTNSAAGVNVSIMLIGPTNNQYKLIMPSTVRLFSGAITNTITTNKSAVVSFSAFNSTSTDIIGTVAIQP